MRIVILIFTLSLSGWAQMHISGGHRPQGVMVRPVGLRMLPGSLKSAYNGIPYCQDLQISRGAPPYALSVNSGALPSGLGLDTAHECPRVTISANPNPVAFGNTVTYTVNISGSSGTPTGNVSLWEGSSAVATASLNRGSVQFTRTYSAAGTYPVIAAYDGDSTYSSDYGGPLTETVQ